MKRIIAVILLFALINNAAGALGFSTAVKAAQMNALAAVAGNAATLTIYSGIQPVTCGAATTALAVFVLGSPFAPTTSTNILYPNLPANATAIASGTASWYRIATSGGSCVVDGTIGTSGSDMNLPLLSINAGLIIVLSTFAMTGGN